MTRHPPRRQRRTLTREDTPARAPLDPSRSVPPRRVPQSAAAAERAPSSSDASRDEGVAGRRAAADGRSPSSVTVWRATGAECAGTLLLVLVAAGGPTIAATGNGSPGRAALALAPGLTVTALIYALGAISGAHFNPVVTLVFAARRDFPWRLVPLYLGAQLLGALVASAFLMAAFGDVGHLGATLPGPRATDAQALVMEAALTSILVLVIIGTALGSRNVGHNSALAVGGIIAATGLFAGAISGASLNPARSLAPALVSGDLRDVWIYLVGPPAGAAAAVIGIRVLHGRSSSTSERVAALGDEL